MLCILWFCFNKEETPIDMPIYLGKKKVESSLDAVNGFVQVKGRVDKKVRVEMKICFKRVSLGQVPKQAA